MQIEEISSGVQLAYTRNKASSSTQWRSPCLPNQSPSPRQPSPTAEVHRFQAWVQLQMNVSNANIDWLIFSERRYMLSPVRLSSVTLVHPTQAVVILGNFYRAFSTFAIH